MNFKRLLVKREGALVRVALNRHEARNALDEIALDEITKIFKDLAKDKTVRVAVLSGQGQDFCAGADIAWMRRAAGYNLAQGKKDAERLIGMCRAVDEAPFPVIARVHGNCFGGALGLVAASDIVVADENAKFRFSEVRLGIIPAVVSTFVLPKIGLSQARRFFLTAELFGTKTAQEIGLVHEATEAVNLDSEIARLAGLILENGPQAVREAKAYLRTFAELSRSKRIVYAVKALAKIRSTPEAKEGFGAFL